MKRRLNTDDLAGSALDSSTMSLASLSLAASWVNVCNREHRSCGPTITDKTGRPKYLPTRLVEVGSHARPVLRLVYTKHLPPETRVFYNALSHCWGKLEFLHLEKVNHDALLENIPYDELTLTFQHMVWFTRSITVVNYVWIDSLCIIQDCLTDWSAESPRMKDVYSNAHLTVAAAHAADGSYGCGSRRNPDYVKPPIVTFQRPSSWRTWWSSLLPAAPQDPPDGSYVVVDDWLFQREIDRSPLAKRAWVAQERFLSKRVLYFGRTQLLYECAEVKACESFPRGIPISAQYSPVLAEAQAVLQQFSVVGSEEVSLENRMGVWRAVVELYSSLALTYHKDKLVALSGIAEQVAPYMGLFAKYSAGIWTDDASEYTVAQLVWKTMEPKPRAAVPAAPTWSWASVDSPVLNVVDLPLDFRHVHVPLAFCHWPVELELDGDSRYGPVSGGVIRLMGTLIPATVAILDNGGYRGPRVMVEVRGSHFDCDLDTSDEKIDEVFVCVPVLKEYIDGAFERLDGLILRRVASKQGRYRRIGTFCAHDDEDDWEELSRPLTAEDLEGIPPSWYDDRVDNGRGPEHTSFYFTIE